MLQAVKTFLKLFSLLFMQWFRILQFYYLDLFLITFYFLSYFCFIIILLVIVISFILFIFYYNHLILCGFSSFLLFIACIIFYC